MGITVTVSEDLGDGTVRVRAHTSYGSDVDVVMGRDMLGTADMYRVLETRGAQVDRQVSALNARRGGAEHDG